MQFSLLASVILHILLIVLLIFGIPHIRPEINQDYAIVVDVVNISELTNVKVTNSKKDKPKINDQAKAVPKSVTRTEEEEKPELKEKLKEDKAKEIKKLPDDNSEKVPQKKKELEKAKKKSKKEIQKEKEEEKKKKLKEKKKKKEPDIFEKAILKSLEESNESDKDKKKIEKLDESSDIDALKGDTNKDYNPELPMSLSEIDAIKSQIEKHWNTSAFSGGDSVVMYINLRVELDQEGNVLNVIPKRQHSASQHYDAFVDSAVRAVKMASPIQNLPIDKYGTWKEIELNFDSSGMIY